MQKRFPEVCECPLIHTNKEKIFLYIRFKEKKNYSLPNSAFFKTSKKLFIIYY